MSDFIRNSGDMPIPDFAYTDRHEGRVFIFTIDDDGNRHKKVIGHITDSSEGNARMVPNKYFRDTYSDLFKEAYPDAVIEPASLSIGMYAMTLGIGTKTGLYPILQKLYGPLYANSILDYCMFTILHRSTVTQIFEKTMNTQVLFADKLHGDSWYSVFFAKKINEDMHHQFRIRWIRKLVENGLKKVWLCVDGSNNDCEARQSHLAKFGFPKSHNQNKTIVGYMYVVDAETGRPVTYYVYNGSVPDSQAFQIISTFLGSFNIEIEGMILDRGFAVESVFAQIEEKRWKYVVMLPGDTAGHKQMFLEHGEEIRWKSRYALENDAIFGISDEKKLFSAHERVSEICLFFDGSSGSEQSARLIRQIQAARRKIGKAIENGGRTAVPAKLKKYLSIEGEGADRKIVTNYEAWDQSMSSKGYYSIAVSKGITPERANELYKMRDTSETQYSILKSQEGGHTTRVHKTEGIQSKFAMLFISSIIRFELEYACRKIGLDTNPVIQELNEIILLNTAEGKYEAVRNLTAEQKLLFEEFDLQQDDLEHMAREYNRRNNKDAKNPDRTLPPDRSPLIVKNSHRKGRRSTRQVSAETAEEQPAREKSKGGRPKGSKDTSPRKPRSDKGKKRGPRQNN